METLIEEFLVFMQTKKAAANNTILSYRRDLSEFLRFCANHPGQPTVKTMDSKTIRGYNEWLKEQNIASATINRRFAALRSFLGYLKAKKLIKENLVEEMAFYRKGSKTILEVLTDKKIKKLLEILAKRATPEGIRDSAMIELFLATGMQPSELVSLDLKMADLDAEYPEIKICHRGNIRKISLPFRVVLALSKYIQEARLKLISGRSEKALKEKALFLNQRGERLTRGGVWLIIRQCAHSANLKNEVTPRALRYNFAARQLALGVSSEKLQQLLGHTHQYSADRFRERLQI